jgi:DNA-binding HxlR family transcriptional regulator
MAGNSWKVVMDFDGVTVGSDLFQLTTSSAASTQLGTVLTELQAVTMDNYGQYCGLARAAEMIGERWGLLIMRDLLVSPKTVTQLRVGLPRISVDQVTMRLREMERGGVVRRLGPVGDDAVYEVTEYGRSVEDALLALSRWGAMSLGAPRPEDVLTEDALAMALRSMFRPETARELTVAYELNVDEAVVNAVVNRGTLAVSPGTLPGADLVIHAGTVLRELLVGAVTTDEAIAAGMVTVTGDAELLPTFVEMFHLSGPAPKYDY